RPRPGVSRGLVLAGGSESQVVRQVLDLTGEDLLAACLALARHVADGGLHRLDCGVERGLKNVLVTIGQLDGRLDGAGGRTTVGTGVTAVRLSRNPHAVAQ